MPDLLDRTITEAGFDRDELARLLIDALRVSRAAAHATLTQAEVEALDDAPRASAEAVSTALIRGQLATRAYLRAHSLSLGDAARRLGVDPSGLRHRIARGTLAAFDLGDGLRVPTWQFTDSGLLPHLGPVLAAVRPHLTPLESARLMTTRRDILGGQTVPEWLATGGDLAPVLRIAADSWHR